jgi:hypothetical protein
MSTTQQKRSNIQTLLAEMNKAAGVDAINPPTSHESGGTPDDLTTVTTGEYFAEQSAADKDRPGPTAEDNKVTGNTGEESATVPTTTKPTGEDPKNERDVTGDIKDPNQTSHPANGNFGEKYSSDDFLAKAAQTIESLVQSTQKRMTELAVQGQNGGQNKSAGQQDTQQTAQQSTEQGKQAGDANQSALSSEELAKNAEIVESIRQQTGNDALAEFFRGRSEQEIMEMQKVAHARVIEAREYGDVLATILADSYDQIKVAAAQQQKQANQQKSTSSQGLNFFSQLKRALEEEGGDYEETDDAASSDGSGGAADMGGDSAGAMVDPTAVMGGGGDMGGGDDAAMAAAAGEDMGMGGGIDPELMAMLEAIAKQEGMSVEELLMLLASKQASEVLHSKKASTEKPIDKTSEQYKKLHQMCKTAIEAANDLLNRGQRK